MVYPDNKVSQTHVSGKFVRVLEACCSCWGVTFPLSVFVPVPVPAKPPPPIEPGAYVIPGAGVGTGTVKYKQLIGDECWWKRKVCCVVLVKTYSRCFN